MIKGRDGTESNTIIPERKKNPILLSKRKAGEGEGGQDHFLKENGPTAHSQLPQLPTFSLVSHGAPALWLSGVVPKPSLQTPDVPVSTLSDMGKPKIWVYGGYQDNLNGISKYLPVACYQSLSS